jgi:2-oxoglutarate dehydrogenase E1 component
VKKSQDDLMSADNLVFVEELYNLYLSNPGAVDPSWVPVFREYFPAGGHPGVEPAFRPRGLFEPLIHQAERSEALPQIDDHDDLLDSKTKNHSVNLASRARALLRAYRLHGHLASKIDPLGLPHSEFPPELEVLSNGISDHDWSREVVCEALFGSETVTLQRVLKKLEALYCGSIGVELQNITNPQQRKWLRTQIERNDFAALDDNERRQIIEGLSDADAFETFLHTKYVGAKRFSLTGGDALIPMMRSICEHGSSDELQEVIIGMAHRGRLNVLHNILGKPANAMLSEFEKVLNPEDFLGSSDVKYHMGHSTDITSLTGQSIHMTLTFNPSHLEFVNPVVLGRSRAKQDRCGEPSCRKRVLPLLLHGDAAFSGQGIVAEALNLGNLHGYDVGGTIHIVINNQIGFTALPEESRSTTYATDIAKILECPIFHLNGNDPEACVRASKLAIEFRQKFGQDVILDLICYRRYGHNEGDEPRFTQPMMYAVIDELEHVRQSYGQYLVKRGVLQVDEPDAMWNERMNHYQEVFDSIHETPLPLDVSALSGVWRTFKGGEIPAEEPNTAVELQQLQEIGAHLSRVPETHQPHRTIARFLRQREAMTTGERKIDWGMAEAFAFGTIIAEGTRVRLSGQDSVRGTFSHRHAAITDVSNGDRHWPLRSVGTQPVHFDVYNSMLSEAAVLGFEYGYSLDYPEALVCWEAQFGDFANGAQVIIDQFISSGEDKWKRLAGLVMLLPHGYEGQGPEHSSARLERFLQLCAEDNMYVCNLTEPAQYFHALRRQVIGDRRKPLIVMSPKSLLRHREAVSDLNDFVSATFNPILDDPRGLDVDHVQRVILCSGKIYYDLIAHARSKDNRDTAIVRVEQLFPLRGHLLKTVVEGYGNVSELMWVQEEPQNMGSWSYIFPLLMDLFDRTTMPRYVGRPPSASPATGSKESHQLEQLSVLRAAFGEIKSADLENRT